MKINKCYLNSTNTFKIKGKSISERLKESDYYHLWEPRSHGTIDTVIIHYISALDFRKNNPFEFESIIEIFLKFEVSAHYLIERNGTIYHLVPEEEKAWHCGGSIMPKPDLRQCVNEFSLGVELVATHDSGFTESQYESLGLLCHDIETRWDIKHYHGHSDIAGVEAVEMGLRSEAKPDPGELFKWEYFFKKK